MRVAALYDIHGNLPALEAVLEDIERTPVDCLVVGGDVVPGPMPGQCLTTLQQSPLPVHFLYGNGERDVLAAHHGQPLTRVPPLFREPVRWVASRLDPGQLASLAEWPFSFGLDLAGLGRVFCCHATPRSDNEIFTRLTPEHRLRPILGTTGADVVLCGHTHMQFDRRIGNIRVINPGSVGMPFGEPGAYWALLTSQGVELRHTAYDLEAASARIRTTGYPFEFDVKNPPAEADLIETFEAAALRAEPEV